MYKQTQDVSWLNTFKGTLWVETGIDNYIPPIDLELWTTPLGVDLDLLDEKTETLFEKI